MDKYKEGDIVKKELYSRQSWTVVNDSGKLRLQPNTNAHFKDTEITDFEDIDYHVLINISGMDFSSTGGNHWPNKSENNDNSRNPNQEQV